MKRKKILLLPLLLMILTLSVVINIRPLYAAEGAPLNYSIPTEVTPIYDELDQLSGISWTNNPLSGFDASGMFVITVDNILNESINFDKSRLFTTLSMNIFYPRNEIPLSSPYQFIVDIEP
ncbi:MAG: hypothetical protein PQJ44_09525, partial [Sphaerochaetaceae bacterium]|nr:hypothetical protein [Sphaerochaetaceae bacterium]